MSEVRWSSRPRHVVFKEGDIVGLTKLGISRVMVEVSPTGVVLREIGFDSSNKIIYRFPGEGRFGMHGLFDVTTISVSDLSSDLSLEEFNVFFEKRD